MEIYAYTALGKDNYKSGAESEVSRRANVLRGYFYDDFWVHHFPDICVLQLEKRMEFNVQQQLPQMIRLPTPKRSEVKLYHRECLVHGHDSWSFEISSKTSSNI